MLGGMLTKFGRNDEAIKLYEDLLKRLWRQRRGRQVVSRTPSLSVIYVNKGNYAKGEAELEALLQRNPDDAGPNNDLGYLYAEQGKNLEKAETMIRKALREDARRIRLSRQPGLGPVQTGQAQGSLEEMKKAAERMKARSSKTGRTRTPRSSNISATSTSSSRSSTRPEIRGGRP